MRSVKSGVLRAPPASNVTGVTAPIDDTLARATEDDADARDGSGGDLHPLLRRHRTQVIAEDARDGADEQQRGLPSSAGGTMSLAHLRQLVEAEHFGHDARLAPAGKFIEDFEPFGCGRDLGYHVRSRPTSLERFVQDDGGIVVRRWGALDGHHPEATRRREMDPLEVLRDPGHEVQLHLVGDGLIVLTASQATPDERDDLSGCPPQHARHEGRVRGRSHRACIDRTGSILERRVVDPESARRLGGDARQVSAHVPPLRYGNRGHRGMGHIIIPSRANESRRDLPQRHPDRSHTHWWRRLAVRSRARRTLHARGSRSPARPRRPHPVPAAHRYTG